MRRCDIRGKGGGKRAAAPGSGCERSGHPGKIKQTIRQGYFRFQGLDAYGRKEFFYRTNAERKLTGVRGQCTDTAK